MLLSLALNCADGCIVTLLAVIASHAIAVPLSPEFPANELRYIVNQSEAFMVLSSSKFKDKISQVTKEGLENPAISVIVEKKEKGSTSSEEVSLDSVEASRGGMMLYTSGTTSRPVRLCANFQYT